MKAVFLTTLRRIGWGKLSLVWIFTAAYALLSDRQPMAVHLLDLLCNQYYQIYVILLLLLLVCGSAMEDENETVICRFPSFFSYFLAKWGALYGVCLLILAGQLLLMVLSGLGEPIHAPWGTVSDERFTVLACFFKTPWTAVILCILWLLLGYGLLSFLTLLLGHFLTRIQAVAALFFLYTLSIFAIKLPIWSRPPFSRILGLNHWMLLLHSLTRPDQLAWTLLQSGLMLIFGLWLLRKHWGHTRTALQKQEDDHGTHHFRKLR